MKMDEKDFDTYAEASMYDIIRISAEKYSDNISYNYFGNKVTYKEFLRRIDECAGAFAKLGVNKGDRVSICMPNMPEAIICVYALNKIGAVANMIHPLSAEREIKYYIEISESSLIVTADIAAGKILSAAKDTGLLKCIVVPISNSMPALIKLGYYISNGRKSKPESSNMFISWKEFIRKGRKHNTTFAKGNSIDVAAILYSGGTTGYPKGIELTNLNFNSLAGQSVEACACLKEKDKVLAIMPVFHGFGLGICIHTVQYFGGTSILVPKFSAKTFGRLIKKYTPDVIAGVPSLYEALLKCRELSDYDLSFLKCVISGGDSLSVSLKKKMDKFLAEHGAGVQIREGYGLTECVTGSCLTPVDRYVEGSIGIAYPDTTFRIVQPETLCDVPYETEGEIIINGPTVMKGYLKDEEETNRTLVKDKDGSVWLRTGDLGYMDKDGFVYFRQRIKRMIISSGYNIYPQYIENIIDSHPKVMMSCVVGIPNKYRGEVVKAFVIPNGDCEVNDELLRDVKEYCEKELAKYSWPYEYEFVKEFPKTLVGKIDYRKLKEG